MRDRSLIRFEYGPEAPGQTGKDLMKMVVDDLGKTEHKARLDELGIAKVPVSSQLHSASH